MYWFRFAGWLAVAVLVWTGGCTDGPGQAPDAGPRQDAQECPPPQDLWEDIDLTAFTELPRLEDLDAAGEVMPAGETTYWELRRSLGGTDMVLLSAGEACAEASDPAACESELAAMTSNTGFHISCLPAGCHHYIAVNRGDDIELVTTREELVSFLGTIDSTTEAALLAFADGYAWEADDPTANGARAVDDGYELLVSELVSDCAPIQTDRVQLQISTEGDVEVVRRNVYSVLCNACI